MGGGGELRVDRERFLGLVCVIAAQACGSGTVGDGMVSAPVLVVPVAAVAGDAGGVEVARSPVAPSSPVASGEMGDVAPSACEQANDTGSVDCTKFRAKKLTGPACEGVMGTCDLLAKDHAYRKRSAQAVAECFDRLGKRACDIYARKKCFEEGVKAACPEPRFEAQCEAKMDECRAAGVRIQYTKEDCVKAMSSQKDRDRAWAISQMGPSAEGKCQLMFTVF